MSRAGQAQIDFVDERRGLKGVAGSLSGEVPSGDAPQLLEDHGQKRRQGGLVAAPPILEQSGDRAVGLTQNKTILTAAVRLGRKERPGKTT